MTPPSSINKNGVFKREYLFSVVRFVIIGGSNFFLTYVVYLISLQFVVYTYAFLIALVAGLLWTSILTIRHAFLARLTVLRIVIYGSYYLAYSYANLSFITMLIENFGVDERWAPLISLTVLTPVHFLLSKVLVASFSRLGDGGSTRIGE